MAARSSFSSSSFLGPDRVHVRREEADAVLALAFNVIHGEVCVAHELLLARAIVGVERHADAHARAKLAVAKRKRLAQRVQDLGRDCLGTLASAELGDEGDEFVAADPRQGIAAAQTAPQPRRHLLQELVALHVPVGVVHLLEAVEVDEEHGQVALVEKHAPGARDRLPQPVEEERAVRQSGERIVGCMEAADLLGLLAVGDVAGHTVGAEKALRRNTLVAGRGVEAHGADRHGDARRGCGLGVFRRAAPQPDLDVRRRARPGAPLAACPARGPQIVVVDDDRVMGADELVLLEAEQGGEAIVDEPESTLGIQEEDEIRRAIDEISMQALRPFQARGRRAVFVSEPARRQRIVDRAAQEGGIERLADVLERAAAQCRERGFDRIVAAHHDHREVEAPFPDPARESHAGALRQPDVDDREIDPLLLQDLDGLGHAAALEDLATAALNQPEDACPLLLVVVQEQKTQVFRRLRQRRGFREKTVLRRDHRDSEVARPPAIAGLGIWSRTPLSVARKKGKSASAEAVTVASPNPSPGQKTRFEPGSVAPTDGRPSTPRFLWLAAVQQRSEVTGTPPLAWAFSSIQRLVRCPRTGE